METINLETGEKRDSHEKVVGYLTPWSPDLSLIGTTLALGRDRPGGVALWDIVLVKPSLFARAHSIPHVRGRLNSPFCHLRAALGPHGYELAEVSEWSWVIRAAGAGPVPVRMVRRTAETTPEYRAALSIDAAINLLADLDYVMRENLARAADLAVEVLRICPLSTQAHLVIGCSCFLEGVPVADDIRIASAIWIDEYRQTFESLVRTVNRLWDLADSAWQRRYSFVHEQIEQMRCRLSDLRGLFDAVRRFHTGDHDAA